MRKTLALILVLFMFLLPALGEGGASAVLSQGSSGTAVRQLQERLIELGLLKGRADGLYGKATATAVSGLQRHLASEGHQVAVDGIAGPATLQLVYDDKAVGKLMDLKVGDRGERVSQLQAQLYDMRLLTSLPDGAFGEQTRQAVEAVQQMMVDHGIEGAEISGVADLATRTALAGNLLALGLRLPQTFDDRYPEALTGLDLFAHSAVVLDRGSGKVYLGKDMDTRRFPASTTKIMTLLLALEKLPLDKVVTIPAEAKEVPEDSSLTPVTPGEQMPVKDLLMGLMLRSGNDAANAVAVLHSGSVAAFVDSMNRRAEALGLNNTHFMNPHGYHDPEHYTTARDMATLTHHALSQPGFEDIIRTTSYQMQPTARRGALDIEVNTDLFRMLSPYYYPGAFGVKSGYTRAAGFCYVGAATRDGRTLLAVVLGDRTRNQGWTDLGRLYNLGFASK